MTADTISPLRQRMIEDMNARKLSPGTQRGHIRACKRVASFSSARRTWRLRMMCAASSCI